MLTNSLPDNEPQRQAALQSYQILDTAPDSDFDDITELASALCEVPIALISFLDRDRQWFKSRKGLDISEINKAYSFCTYALLQPNQLMVVEDVRKDERFVNNPFVLGEPFVVFFGCVPLINQDGYALGSLCIIDTQPRQLNDWQLSALKTLARQVVDKLELRQKVVQLQEANAEVKKLNQILHLNEQRLEYLMNTINVGIAITDAKGKITYVNPAAEQILHLNKENIIERSYNDSRWQIQNLDGSPMADEQYATATVLRTGKPISDKEFVLHWPDGMPVFLTVSTAPLVDENNQVTGTISTFSNITERKQDEYRKNDFIGMVSHELKTPITSIAGFLEILLLKATQHEDSSGAGMLSRALIQVKKMTGMINGFLNVSKLNSGKIVLNTNPFNLDDLIREITEEQLLLHNSHQVKFDPCEDLVINADREKIGSVISNLLSNAIKYSPKNTTIWVHCTSEEEMVKISVADEGKGITEEDQAKLFERFYRAPNTETRKVAGFGIGLYLCAEIVHRHKGEIGVESTPGRGSTFWFTLPLH